MLKTVVRFLLAVCILLIGGYSQLSAHIRKEISSQASEFNAAGVEFSTFQSADKALAYFHQASSSGVPNAKKRKFILAENDTEETESVSFKKLLESSDAVAAIFLCPDYRVFIPLYFKMLTFL